MSNTNRVTVYIDGKPRVVPITVDCHYAARGALGMRRGEGVGYESDRDPLKFIDGHTFKEGDCYVTVSIFEYLESKDLFGQDSLSRAPWSENPDTWKE